MQFFLDQFVYVFLSVFLDGVPHLAADFKSSLNEAVLKFYPAASKTPRVSSICLKFQVDMTSAAVQLLMAVMSDMSGTNTNSSTTELPSANNVNYRRPFGHGSHSITVFPGRQYVEFTAMKIRVTRISDRVVIRYIRLADGPCRDNTMRKYQHIRHCHNVIHN